MHKRKTSSKDDTLPTTPMKQPKKAKNKNEVVNDVHHDQDESLSVKKGCGRPRKRKNPISAPSTPERQR